MDAEKSYGRETVQKMDFTGVEIAWVDADIETTAIW